MKDELYRFFFFFFCHFVAGISKAFLVGEVLKSFWYVGHRGLILVRYRLSQAFDSVSAVPLVAVDPAGSFLELEQDEICYRSSDCCHTEEDGGK